MIHILTKLFYKCNWTELAYGFFALKTSTVRKLDLNEFEAKVSSRYFFTKLAYGQGFEIEAVIFCRAVRRNLKVLEFPLEICKIFPYFNIIKLI